jgi:hypothetical protein
MLSDVLTLRKCAQEHEKTLRCAVTQAVLGQLRSVYALADSQAHRSSCPNHVLRLFQQALSTLPEWSHEEVEHAVREQHLDVEEVSCALEAYTILQARVDYAMKLAADSGGSGPGRGESITLSVPNPARFFHACLCTAARSLYQVAYIMYPPENPEAGARSLVRLERLVRAAVVSEIKRARSEALDGRSMVDGEGPSPQYPECNEAPPPSDDPVDEGAGADVSDAVCENPEQQSLARQESQFLSMRRLQIRLS